MVSVDAVATLKLLIVDLSLRVAERADSSNEVVTWKASARSNGGIPNLVSLASSSADSVGGVIAQSRRADAARVSDEVVSILANTFSINVFFIRVASRSAEAEVLNKAFIADALFGSRAVSRLERAESAGSIGKLEVLGKADARLAGDIVDSPSITGDSAYSESLIIDFVPIALTADSVNWVESSDAAALSVREDLIHSASDNAIASLVSVT